MIGRPGNAQIVRAMSAYGGLFKVVDTDSIGAKNLAKAATAGVGFLSPDATFEECSALIQRGVEANVNVVEEYLKHLQVEASLYGLPLNLTKTELLKHPKLMDEQLRFANGDPVPVAESVKYLRSQVSWNHPTNTALHHRYSLAKTSFTKLQHLWRSSLPRKTRVHIFQANIVSTLIYGGVASLTMEPKHFQKLDSWYFQLLRRVLGIKSSYYSRISNKEVWKQAGRPVTPSQSVLSQQFRLLLQTLQADRMDPVHHVAFGPAYKDRVYMHKHHKRGPPPPHWLSLVSQHA